MLKRLFSYLLFGFTCTNLAFGMQKDNSDYLPVIVDFNKIPKAKHSLATLLKNDAAVLGIVNRYGAATPVQSTRYAPVLKDFKIKTYDPAYDDKLEWPLNEPISLKTRAQNYLRDEVSAKNMAWSAGKLAARMAAIGLIQFSSTLVHEYGHALVTYYIQNGIAHIFMGASVLELQDTKLLDVSEENFVEKYNKFPRFTISKYDFSQGLSFCAYPEPNPRYMAFNSIAGPLAGAIYNLALIKMLRVSNLNTDNYTNCFMNINLTRVGLPLLNQLLLKALICKNPLESQAQADLIQNIANIIPINPACDGYRFLQECGIPKPTLESAAKILNPVFAQFFTIAIAAESGGIWIKLLSKTINPEFYKVVLMNDDNQECGDLEALTKTIKNVYSQIKQFKNSDPEHTLTKIANTSK